MLIRLWKWFWGRPTRTILDDWRVGRRFCKVEMNGCMAQARGREQWGRVIAVGEGGTGSFDQPKRVQYLYVRNRQNSWLLVKYDDGHESWEPLWWTYNYKDRMECQI